MTDFVPLRVYPSYHFDIKRNLRGYWIARDRHGLAGGTFLTRKGALRFALFESGGDSARVHAYPAAQAARNTNGVTPGQGNYLERRSPECRIAVPRRSLADPRRAVIRKECGTRAAGRWQRGLERHIARSSSRTQRRH